MGKVTICLTVHRSPDHEKPHLDLMKNTASSRDPGLSACCSDWKELSVVSLGECVSFICGRKCEMGVRWAEGQTVAETI